jgi:beta-phosphoglucomutase-like phosphatase (HAD superfamily)
MIEVLMLDLGNTLVTGSPPVLLPGVPQALADLQSLTTSAGAPLPMCLVSNFTDLMPPATPNQVMAAEKQYRTTLQHAGLSQFFSPFEKTVTLSTHVGVRKPDCRVFHAALARLGLASLPLERCLLITEEAAHVAKVRSYGMKALRFGTVGVPGVDFSAWRDAKDHITPLL